MRSSVMTGRDLLQLFSFLLIGCSALFACACELAGGVGEQVVVVGFGAMHWYASPCMCVVYV